MEIRKPRWLLLATVLSFASSFGCSSDAPSNPDKEGDDDTDTTESPSAGDDDADDTTADDDGDDDDDTPVLDAGKPNGSGGERDAGGNPTPRNDASSGSNGGKDAGSGSNTNADAGGSSGGKDSGAATGGDDGGSTTPGTGAGGGGCGPAATMSATELHDTKNLGPWKPMHVERTGPSGASWIFYPEGLGKDGMKHPVFQWGPGAGTGPDRYVDHLNLLASHGIVVISQSSTNSGKQALTWLLEQNEKQGGMWSGKLDPNRVGRGGHSMGALQSMREADDDRLKATVLVCGGTMSGRGGGGAAAIDYPSLFLGGVGESGTRNFAGDYAEVKGPSIFVTRTTSNHIDCARDNMGPWVAFLRWQLCGEEEQWKKEFMPGGTYCKAPWEACMSKNF